jgi:hypothetical protein
MAEMTKAPPEPSSALPNATPKPCWKPCTHKLSRPFDIRKATRTCADCPQSAPPAASILPRMWQTQLLLPTEDSRDTFQILHSLPNPQDLSRIESATRTALALP